MIVTCKYLWNVQWQYWQYWWNFYCQCNDNDDDDDEDCQYEMGVLVFLDGEPSHGTWVWLLKCWLWWDWDEDKEGNLYKHDGSILFAFHVRWYTEMLSQYFWRKFKLWGNLFSGEMIPGEEKEWQGWEEASGASSVKDSVRGTLTKKNESFLLRRLAKLWIEFTFEKLRTSRSVNRRR